MDASKTAAHFDMTGKVCVVTGGSRGLGKQMCQAFAEAGASVIVSSRKGDACEATAQEIAESTGATVIAKACHVADWDQCDALLDVAYAKFGKVDVLVNNAGMSPLYAKLSDVSRDLWDKVIGVNLAGPFRLSAIAAERMAAGDGGSIINVSSIASIAPGAAEIPYGTAKAGLNNLTESMAHAYGPKVRVNCILPGPFLTDISNAWDDNVKEHFKKIAPLQRAGNPDEIVGLALYLASDASTYTTGALIKVDGGIAYG
ncbi:MAG: SDR family NAD(P)-dependent oxidoreductase [Alphaproteobacteria bacterium]